MSERSTKGPESRSTRAHARTSARAPFFSADVGEAFVSPARPAALPFFAPQASPAPPPIARVREESWDAEEGERIMRAPEASPDTESVDASDDESIARTVTDAPPVEIQRSCAACSSASSTTTEPERIERSARSGGALGGSRFTTEGGNAPSKDEMKGLVESLVQGNIGEEAGVEAIAEATGTDGKTDVGAATSGVESAGTPASPDGPPSAEVPSPDGPPSPGVPSPTPGPTTPGGLCVPPLCISDVFGGPTDSGVRIGPVDVGPQIFEGLGPPLPGQTPGEGGFIGPGVKIPIPGS